MSTRKFFIAANFKMNKTFEEMHSYCQIFKDLCSNNSKVAKVDIAIAPPAVFLDFTKQYLQENGINIMAQNCHWQDCGAYTGELSSLMLKSLGVDKVIIGHSERRNIFFESNDLVGKKINSCLKHSLTPILCVGENQQERKDKKTLAVIKEQLESVFNQIESFTEIIIAYEPVWAIGTGLTAEAKQIQEVHNFIRDYIAERFSDQVAQKTVVIYGGSVNKNIVSDLLLLPDVDGALVGGASLNPYDFFELVKIAFEYQK